MINLRALALTVGLCLVAVACGSSSTGGAGGAGGKSGAGGNTGAGGASAGACVPSIPTTGTTCTQADLDAYGTCFASKCPAFQACYAPGGACAATVECTDTCSTCARTAAAGCLTVCPLPSCILGGVGGASGGLGGSSGGLGGSSGTATCLQQLATCCLSAATPTLQVACGTEAQDLAGMGALAETSCGVKLANLKSTYCP